MEGPRRRGRESEAASLGRGASGRLDVTERNSGVACLGRKGWETSPPQSPIGQSGIRGHPQCPEGFSVEHILQGKRASQWAGPG